MPPYQPPGEPAALVVLAGGGGRRFGGVKQLTEVDTRGAWLLDYTLYDARRAGFGDAVIVIQPDMEQHVRAHCATYFGTSPAIDVAHQQRPLGTGHALLCARSHLERLDRPFAVANADDFYGATAWERLHQYITGGLADGHPARAANVLASYEVRATLSPFGGVSRAVCEIADNGILHGIVELLDVAETNGEIRGCSVAGDPVTLSGSEPVSMNLWGLQPGVLPALGRAFERFLATSPPSGAEFRLSDAMDALVRRGEARVQVVAAESNWFGLTFAEDLPHLIAGIEARVAAGDYPIPPAGTTSTGRA